MNAQSRAILEPLYPAPLAYQAEAVLSRALEDNEREFTRRRAELLNEYVGKAEAIRGAHMTMLPGKFIERYGK